MRFICLVLQFCFSCSQALPKNSNIILKSIRLGHSSFPICFFLHNLLS